MPDITLPINTERLILRRFEGHDLDAFHAYHSMPETARFLPGPAKTYTQSMERVGKYANFVFEKEGDWVCLAIEAKGSAGLLGEVVLKWLPGRGQGEVGWTLAPGARGKGYATEAAEAVLRLGFEELGYHRSPPGWAQRSFRGAVRTAGHAAGSPAGGQVALQGPLGHRAGLRHPGDGMARPRLNARRRRSRPWT